jgi:hypothetical protein
MRKEPERKKLTDAPSCSDKEPIKLPLKSTNNNQFLEEESILDNSSNEDYSQDNS